MATIQPVSKPFQPRLVTCAPRVSRRMKSVRLPPPPTAAKMLVSVQLMGLAVLNVRSVLKMETHALMRLIAVEQMVDVKIADLV